MNMHVSHKLDVRIRNNGNYKVGNTLKNKSILWLCYLIFILGYPFYDNVI